MKPWKTFGAHFTVYVEANTVPGSTAPMYGTEMLYCTCSDTLELKGGRLNASGGLTLLPPGKLFVQLCLTTFGLYEQKTIDDGTYIETTVKFIDSKCSEEDQRRLEQRIVKAIEFNESSMSLGEQVICFPEKVEMLLDVFNGVDGFDDGCFVWEELKSNPFLNQNLEKARRAMREQTMAAGLLMME